MHRTSLGLSFVTVVCLLAAVAGAETIKINFQPQESVTPRGYLPDSGRVFGDRRNGYSYGWNRDVSADARERNSANAPDQRYDTLVHFSKSGVPATWEIALPNGTYSVFLACGEPSYSDQANHIDIERHVMIDEDPQSSSAPDFDEFRVTVSVSDGRLTIKPAPQAANPKVMFVEITGGSSSGSSGGYSGGSGAAAAPYRIATAQDLIDLGNTPSDYDKHFDLVGDIDMAGTVFADAVIASGEVFFGNDADGVKFTGEFNGNGHLIRNLTIDSRNSGGSHIALFGHTDSDAQIHHLGMENCRILSDGDWVGAIAGQDNGGQVYNCYANCQITCDGSYVGGIVGQSWGSIVNCHSHGRIQGGSVVGGVAGQIQGQMQTCYSAAEVTASGGWVGGVVGGAGNPACVSLSFCDAESSGASTWWGGFGRTTSEMKKASTFVGWGSEWTVREGWDCPRLAWENAAGVPIDNVPERTYSGAGTEADPFRLSEPADLLTLCARARDWAGCFELTRDIDMSGVSGYLPIGRFEGTWNGNGYAITDLTIDLGTETSFVGLIGYAYLADVSNVRMVRPVIRGGFYCGALIGASWAAMLTNCSSERGSLQGVNCVGGLVGRNDQHGVYDQSMTSCFNSTDVEALQHVGGLAGYTRGDVANCYNEAFVTATHNDAGGIAGYSMSDMTNCYNVGPVYCPGANVGNMTGKYAAGTMSHCFWDAQASGVAAGCVIDTDSYRGPGTVVNSAGRTTAQMKVRAVYVSAGWDFVGETGNGTDDIWTMPSGGGYPLLAWQEESVSNATADDFETGTFSVFDYSHAGEALWSVDGSVSASGMYSARSGDVDHSGSSRLMLTRDCQAGRIHFMVKVSSESDFDILHFRIDGQEMDTWSGDLDWMEASYSILAGSHTFEWRYEKDRSQDEGEDAAWIDDITFLTP